MSGDLISKSTLLEDIRNSITECSGIMDWLKLIDRQPTAYNLDKVVEQLEADITCRGRLDGYIPKYKAIDIVKAGGVE